MGKNERWTAEVCFGVEPVVAVLGEGSAHDIISDDHLVAIARASTVPYWTNGQRLFSSEGPAKHLGARSITALEALKAFSLDQLENAREFGSTP
jgi:hypothetical protein